MSSSFPANRIAAVAAFLTGLSGAILAITNSFPKNWQNAVIAIASILGAIATALHFMLGSQKNDANLANVRLAQIQFDHAKLFQELNESEPEPAPVAKPTQMPVTEIYNPIYDHESEEQHWNESTPELTLNPDHNPESALAPQPEIDESVTTPPAFSTE
jgi:hypothetical protein